MATIAEINTKGIEATTNSNDQIRQAAELTSVATDRLGDIFEELTGENPGFNLVGINIVAEMTAEQYHEQYQIQKDRFRDMLLVPMGVVTLVDELLETNKDISLDQVFKSVEAFTSRFEESGITIDRDGASGQIVSELFEDMQWEREYNERKTRDTKDDREEYIARVSSSNGTRLVAAVVEENIGNADESGSFYEANRDLLIAMDRVIRLSADSILFKKGIDWIKKQPNVNNFMTRDEIKSEIKDLDSEIAGRLAGNTIPSLNIMQHTYESMIKVINNPMPILERLVRRRFRK